MAKISPVSIKYMIHARFEAIGPVEKPDVIGALFGQTEGLLGADLEIRELQKEGKIGRIEVDVKSSDGRSTGKIEIPTAIDKSETSLIAAAIETIDRIGPTEAKIEVESIEDVRGNKRDYILERAKKLLESMDQDTNSKEISNTLRTSARASKIQEYGEEKLPAGELEENEIIVVEGRADVINLLENRITNVIGMNGTKLPKEIAELGKKKELTLFLDGDRGGKLIAKNVMENASVAYVAFAPDGKEVEELNGKEILASLRRKIPAKEFSSSRDFFDKSYGSLDESKSEDNKKEIDKNKLAKILKELSGTKSTYFFDDNLELIRKTSNSNAGREIKELQRVAVIIIDGKAMPSLIQSAEQINVKFIAAKNFSEAPRGSIEFISF
ncbi:DNA primase [Candidatus Pacearchaeota archaeon]|nr:DNA primase [Candidatus Pacearchaeota archaeon]